MRLSRRARRIALLFLGISVALPTGLTAWLYIAAPVDSLRTSVTYTPPFSSHTRQLGLAMPGLLRLQDMPIDLILATYRAEDNEFEKHPGVRPLRIATEVIRSLRKGRKTGGVSTLSQQLAKNVFTGPERTLWRKYVELIHALKIERRFTKEEIFTLYVNMAQTGPNLYGYREAAQAYFGRKLRQLSTMQLVFLVSNLPEPVEYSKWFRARKFNRYIYNRIHYVLLTTLKLRAELVPGGIISKREKQNFFSGYLRRPLRAVCLSDETYAAIHEEASKTVTRFIRRHVVRRARQPTAKI